MSNRVSVRLMSPQEVQDLPVIRQEWERLLDSNDNLELLYQSPQWFEHLMSTDFGDNRLFLGILKDHAGQRLGIVPIRIDRYTLSFDISSYILGKIRLRTASILGSPPLVSQDENLFESLFTTIFETFPDIDCIYMGSVPTNSFLWQVLQKSKKISEDCILHMTDGIQTHHALLLPPTFEEYLSKFKRKKRWDLKRKVEKLRDHGEGRLEMIRVESADQVSSFLEGAISVAEHSWQQRRLGTRIDDNREWHEKLKDLADRGLLRAYLLKCGNQPCAFRLGYQFRDVYNSVQIAHDQSLTEFSPGTVLLYLVIRDLIHYHPPRRLNFGLGGTSHKREFGNFYFEAAEILLWRRTFCNQIKRTSHSTFRGIISSIKTHLPERKSPSGGEENQHLY